jgi:aminopeptidase N
MKFNTKSYILDRSNRKNRPVIYDFESLHLIEKSKDELMYCKAPTIFRYLSYCIGQNVFFDMVKLFISKFRDSVGTFKDFLNCIPQNITGDSKLMIEKHIKDIEYFYLRSKCPPVFNYEIEAQSDLIKNIHLQRSDLEHLSINGGSVICDVKLFYKSEDSSYKYETLSKVEITNQEEITKRFSTLTKPNLMLLNYNDYAYVAQIFTNDEIEWIRSNVTVRRIF